MQLFCQLASGRITMPIVQGGPPEWTWERPTEKLKWEFNRTRSQDGSSGIELRIHCGLEIMRLQFFTPEEIQELQSGLSALTAAKKPLPSARIQT
jgi:hypothetical protein